MTAPTSEKYIMRASMLYGINSAVKFLCFILAFTAILCSSSFLGIAVSMTFVISLAYLSQLDFKNVFSPLKKLCVFFILILAFNTCFAVPQYAEYRFWILAPSVPGLIRGLRIILKTAMITVLFRLFSAVTEPQKLNETLSQIFSPLQYVGIPTGRLAFIIAASIEFVPMIFGEISCFSFLCRSRGEKCFGRGTAGKVMRIMICFFPVLISALSRIEERSLTMAARGFDADHPIANAESEKLTLKDVYAILVCFAVFIFQFLIS